MEGSSPSLVFPMVSCKLFISLSCFCKVGEKKGREKAVYDKKGRFIYGNGIGEFLKNSFR